MQRSKLYALLNTLKAFTEDKETLELSYALIQAIANLKLELETELNARNK